MIAAPNVRANTPCGSMRHYASVGLGFIGVLRPWRFPGRENDYRKSRWREKGGAISTDRKSTNTEITEKTGGHGQSIDVAVNLRSSPCLPCQSLCIVLLKEELRRELHLPGRPRIASGEPRVRNHPECGAANERGAARLTEVGDVEQIEDLGAQLHAR